MLKLLSILFIALISINFCIKSSYAQQGFNAIYAKDNSNVIAVGNNGNIFRTWNGGGSWHSLPLGVITFNTVSYTGQYIWIAGNNGTFHRSTNDGTSFSNSTISVQDLKSLFFLDTNTGWAAGNNGTILKTINGGLNWTTQNSNVTSNLNSIKFTNAQNGIVCGADGKVLQTTDGGNNWTSLSTPNTNELLAIDQKFSTIISTGADGFIIKSTDNGSSWSLIDYKIVSKSRVTSIFMKDQNAFYTCGGGGFIRLSNDGGNSFSFQINPMMGNLVSIFFSDSNNGWAVSSLNNAIIKTNNGGLNWTLPAGTTVSYSWTLKRSGTGNIGNGFSQHPKNKNGIFIMMGNTLYRSLDKGETWSTIGTCNIGGSAHTFYVNAIDTNLMLCNKGASGGYVCRSTDYGQTWTAVWGPGTLTSYGMPLEVDVNNPNTAYLGPDGSVLLKSTNFGLNWVTWGTTSFRSPCDLSVNYFNSNIMFCGDGTTGTGFGEVFKSTNGGINWFSIHTVSGSEIPMIAVTSLDTNLAFHTTWSSGGFWKSLNQGATYTQITTTNNMWACDIAKDDPTAIAYDVYASNCYFSVDGGATFANTNVGSSPAAGMLYYDKGTLFVQHGGGVYKLNISYSVITSNGSISSQIPKEFKLEQNYPNPFNPISKIKYHISSDSRIRMNDKVSLTVYSSLGQKIAVLVDKQQEPGSYEVEFDGTNFPSGVYFYKLETGNFVDTKKMILIK